MTRPTFPELLVAAGLIVVLALLLLIAQAAS